MKSLLRKITGGLERVSEYLVAYGAAGLFAIALIDSAFIPLPGGPDAVMILLSTAHPTWMVFYAIAATLGSTIGCIVLYYISRRAGRSALNRFSPEKQARVKNWIDRYDVLAVLVASILPPPSPFKLFVITSGVLRFNVVRFATGIAAGRFFRFLLEGYLAVRYGEQAGALFRRYYPGIGIGLAVLLVGFFVGRSLWRRRRAAANETLEPQS